MAFVCLLLLQLGTARADRAVLVPRGNCMSVMSEAAASTEDVAALILDIDDTRFHDLASHRQATRQCFDLE